MRNRRKHIEDAVEVDMTPMLDIVFIMLIFFIVTTSFVKESGIELLRPQKHVDNPPIIPDQRPIVIEISANNDVSVSGRLIDIDAVRANIETAKAQSPKSAVIVRAHQDAASGIVVKAVDQSKLAGAVAVTVLKKPS